MGSAWIGFRIALLPFWIALHEATFLAGANRLISGLPQGVLRFWWRIALQRGNGSLDYAPGQTEVKHDLRLCGGRIGCALRVDGINNNVPSGAVDERCAFGTIRGIQRRDRCKRRSMPWMNWTLR